MDISPPETGRRQTVKTKIADAVLSVQPISIENKSTSTNEASAEETVRLGEIVSTPQIVPQPTIAVNRRRLLTVDGGDGLWYNLRRNPFRGYYFVTRVEGIKRGLCLAPQWQTGDFFCQNKEPCKWG